MRIPRTFSAIAMLAIFGPSLASSNVQAAIYLTLPTINGENPTPGYPGAMSVGSFDMSPGNFSVQRTIDSASPQIQTALLNGTNLGTGNMLFYNGSPVGAPAAVLAIQNVLASSQTFGPGTKETDGFVATTPAYIYLEVTGITGESNTPGHPGIMQLDALSMTGNTFTVTRPVDSASPQLQSALILGKSHGAKLLFYNSAPTGAADAKIDFTNVLVSSYSTLSGGDVLKESVGFNYETISQAVPEPTGLVLGGVGAAFLSTIAANRRRKIRL